MKALVSILISAALTAPVIAEASTVYQCLKNGQPVFTDEATDPTCKPVNLQVIEPSPDDVARALEKKRQQTEQAQSAREAAQRDAVIRAQVDAARAAERLAEEQRRRVRQLEEMDAKRQANPDRYWWYPGYGTLSPGHRAYPPAYSQPLPVAPPARPSTPDYPYRPDRATVSGR